MTAYTKEWLLGSILVAAIAAELLFIAAKPAHAAVSDWWQGASMVPQGTTDFGSANFDQSLQDLAATGANAVALVYPVYQDNGQSSSLHAGWNTPTDASLRTAIQQAHALGLKVNLKLHAEVHDGTWRAWIKPNDRNAWYGSYQHHLLKLATIAQEEHVEMITVGTEMVSVAAWSEHGENTQKWQEMIGAVRAVYSGALTYGANSNDNSNSPFTNEKKYIGFWSSLDYASISAYYSLNSDSSVQGLKGAWDYWNNNDLRAFQQSTGKPLLFGEIGYRSIDGSHWNPWDWGRGGAPNEGEQANAYDALMGYWNDHGYMAGVFWWDWSTNPSAGGAGNTHYTPQNKQAETVMTRWFTNPTQPSTPPTNSTASFGSTGSSNPSGTSVGTGVVLSANLKNLTNSSPQNLIVDLEVYDSGNNKVHQQFFENQAFGSQESRTFTTNWNPSAAGTYRMTTGVFTSGWGSALHWNNDAASIAVSGGGSTPPTTPPPTNNPPPQPPSTGSANINIWWPTDGTKVSGTQPLKAVVDGRAVTDYRMFWQVDGGTKVEMFNSEEDYPHKEAWVNYDGWNWRGSGPYTITFVAEMPNSTAQKSVNIYK